jgi:hypothetical protein
MTAHLRTIALFAALLAALALIIGALARDARAEGGGATWRLEQPLPPALPSGQKAATPIGLGKIGDIEFWAPNRGLLITAGNPPTIPPGIWAYNGVTWHELTGPGPTGEGICGATDGRIAWAAADEFWTVSDGRKGQVTIEAPPLEDNTLCHFANGQVVGSYGSIAFLTSSYQAMHGAGCEGPEDCWFGGAPLPEPLIGAFHLHWNGNILNAEPNPQGHPTEDIRNYAGRLYESVSIGSEDQLTEEESPSEPSDLHLIEPNGVQPRFASLLSGVPFYAEGEFPDALGFLRLSSDAQALWGAASPIFPTPVGSQPAEVTVLRNAGGEWRQLLGPSTEPEGANPFTTEPGEEGPQGGKADETVSSLAAEPPDGGERESGQEGAWLALDSRNGNDNEPLASARVARMNSDGTIDERQTLPSAQELEDGVGPKGQSAKIACPAPHDCWLATSQGWLYHLASEGERHLPEDTDPNFAGLINYRPPDAGVPAVVPDAPPEDDSGVSGEGGPVYGTAAELKPPQIESHLAVPLITDLHSKVVHGRTLELRFHLAVKARVRLLARRRKKLVASTPTRTFAAGSRKLLLRLNPRAWPTKLSLQTHALAPLPTTTVKEVVGGPEHGKGGANTEGTGLVVLPTASPFARFGALP